jgi:peptidoglycan/xylan/chitin deacetylase (PgdA/CDA1 family)
MRSLLRTFSGRPSRILPPIVAGLALVGVLALRAGASAPARTVIRDRTDVAGPLDLSRITLGQKGRGLVVSFQVRGKIVGRRLGPLPKPDAAKPHYLCLVLHRSGKAGTRRLCLGRGAKGPWKLGVQRIAADGNPQSERTIAVRMLSVRSDKVRAQLRPAAAGLATGHYKVHAESAWSGPACKTLAACHDRAPSGRSARFELRPVRIAGCSRDGVGLAFHGPTNKGEIALTFDDGPSIYTPKVLAILNRAHVHATFFEIGEQVAGNEAIMNKILDSGDEIGDHTWSHVAFPGFGQIASAKRAIENATGFDPCLFRPPYGSFNSGTVATAKRLGLSTIVWDVDPVDWSTPGTAAIYSRVVSGAHTGSIVLMHDGGGPRGETVAALPRIIRTFKSRGYRMVTVSQLLGQRLRWKPV